MNKIDLNIDIFDWTIKFFLLNKKDTNVNEIGIEYGMLEDDIAYINDKLNRKCLNGAVTLSHTDRLLTLVFIYPTSSKVELINVLSHEIRHVVDRICQHNSIEDIETPAYMTGYITREVFRRIIIIKQKL